MIVNICNYIFFHLLSPILDPTICYCFHLIHYPSANSYSKPDMSEAARVSIFLIVSEELFSNLCAKNVNCND